MPKDLWPPAATSITTDRGDPPCARCARFSDAISETLSFLVTDPQNTLRRAETIRRLTAVLGS